MDCGSGLYSEIFKNKIPDKDKLSSFGFICRADTFVYSVPIVDGQFNMVVCCDKDGKIDARIFDADTQDEYILHLTTDAEGSFVGKVRTEFCNVLQNIAENCFKTQAFKSDGAARVIQYIRETYQDDFEFLWKKFPDNAIVRRKDTLKWYACLLTVKKNKLGLGGDEYVEILDLRMPPEKIEKTVDCRKYFPGYHMNKRSWVTILLDGNVPAEEIFCRINDSYILAKK